jgi:hypothetical protein
MPRPLRNERRLTTLCQFETEYLLSLVEGDWISDDTVAGRFSFFIFYAAIFLGDLAP